MPAVSLVFQILLTLHLIGMALGLGGAFIADFSFFKAIRQADRISPETVLWMRSFSQVVWIGIGLLTLSGAGLFTLHASRYVHSAAFILKMAMVLILIINGLLLNFYATARLTTFNFSEKYRQSDAAWRARKLSFIFGAVSAVTWYSIVVLAMLKSVVHVSALWYGLTYICLLGGAVSTSLLLESYLFRRAQKRVRPDNLDTLPVTELAAYPAQALALIRRKQQQAQQSKPVSSPSIDQV